MLTTLLEAVGQEVPAAVALRRELHVSPELGGQETRTASRVAAALGEPDAPSVTTGRLVRIGAASGPSVAIRAELDALRSPSRRRSHGHRGTAPATPAVTTSTWR